MEAFGKNSNLEQNLYIPKFDMEQAYNQSITENKETFDKYKKYAEEHGQQQFIDLYVSATKETQAALCDPEEFLLVVKDSETKNKLTDIYRKMKEQLFETFISNYVKELTPEELASTIVMLRNDFLKTTCEKMEENM